jgi:hypothetical protein
MPVLEGFGPHLKRTSVGRTFEPPSPNVGHDDGVEKVVSLLQQFSTIIPVLFKSLHDTEVYEPRE